MNTTNGHTLCESIKRSTNIGEEIKAYLIDWEKMDGLPRSHLYVPAEHELFVRIAKKNKFITNTQMLAVNCEIVKRCHLLILYGGYNTTYSNILTEVKTAKANGIAIYTMPDLSCESMQALRFTLKCVSKLSDDDE
jgi:hypothetical protein